MVRPDEGVLAGWPVGGSRRHGLRAGRVRAAARAELLEEPVVQDVGGLVLLLPILQLVMYRPLLGELQGEGGLWGKSSAMLRSVASKAGWSGRRWTTIAPRELPALSWIGTAITGGIVIEAGAAFCSEYRPRASTSGEDGRRGRAAPSCPAYTRNSGARAVEQFGNGD